MQKAENTHRQKTREMCEIRAVDYYDEEEEEDSEEFSL
jgi:hypothetical protein